jgi:hypothetical protein
MADAKPIRSHAANASLASALSKCRTKKIVQISDPLDELTKPYERHLDEVVERHRTISVERICKETGEQVKYVLKYLNLLIPKGYVRIQ